MGFFPELCSRLLLVVCLRLHPVFLSGFFKKNISMEISLGISFIFFFEFITGDPFNIYKEAPPRVSLRVSSGIFSKRFTGTSPEVSLGIFPQVPPSISPEVPRNFPIAPIQIWSFFFKVYAQRFSRSSSKLPSRISAEILKEFLPETVTGRLTKYILEKLQ